MPVTYKIDTARGFIHTQCVGDVTFEEVISHFDILAQDPLCPDRLDVLLDLHDMTSIPNSRQVRAVADRIERLRPQLEFGACAIVVHRDALFGMIRMFAVFAQAHFAVTRVFRELKEAEDWLRSITTVGENSLDNV